LNDLNLIEADVVDEDAGTASKLNFKDEYNEIVNKLNSIADAENVNLAGNDGNFNAIFSMVADGIRAVSNLVDGT
jgi:hypothetical protein